MALPIVALAFALSSPPEASASGDACAARRLLEAANFSSCRLKAASKAAKVGSGIKDEKCDRVLRKKERVVARDCSSTPAPSLTDLRDFLSETTSDVVAAVHGGDSSMLGDSDAEPAEPDNVFGVLEFTREIKCGSQVDGQDSAEVFRVPVRSLSLSAEPELETWPEVWVVDPERSEAARRRQTIGSALADAPDGARVYVCPGSYEEKVKINKHHELRSLGGASRTIIDVSGLSSGSPVGISNSAVFEGFTVTGAHARDYCFTGVIKVSGRRPESDQETVSRIAIRQNHIVYNWACKGGAIYVSPWKVSDADGNPYNPVIHTTVANNVVAHNEALPGVGIYAHIGGGRSTVLVTNNVVTDTHTRSADGEETSPGVGISTGANSDRPDRGSESGWIRVENNIITNHYTALRNGSSAPMSESYNLCWNNDFIGSEATCIIADPRFLARPGFVPGSRSPAIDGGNPARSFNDTDGSRNDIGVYGGPGGSWTAVAP
jgi:hypothetical protein